MKCPIAAGLWALHSPAQQLVVGNICTRFASVCIQSEVGCFSMVKDILPPSSTSRTILNLFAGFLITEGKGCVQAAQPSLGPPNLAQPLPPYTFRATITLALPEVCPDWQNHVKLSFTAASSSPPPRTEYKTFNLEPGFRYGPASQTVDLDFQLAYHPGTTPSPSTNTRPQIPHSIKHIQTDTGFQNLAE
jgi:hypothetical protein